MSLWLEIPMGAALVIVAWAFQNNMGHIAHSLRQIARSLQELGTESKQALNEIAHCARSEMDRRRKDG